MRVLPALDARGGTVREAPTPDLRVCAEVSLGWKAGRAAASNSSRALFADRTCPEASQEAGSLCSVGFKGGYSSSIHFTV